jgi:hypothetical protein
MPNPYNSSASRKARNSAIILIAALVVFSSIAIVQSNVLQWPLAAELQSLKGNNSGSSSNNSTLDTNSDSSIFVWANAYIPITQSHNSSVIFGKIPIAGALVKLFENASTTGPGGASHGRLNLKGVLVNSNATNPTGQVRFRVPSGRYLVSLASQYGNFSVTVSTEAHNTTEVDLLVNESSYNTSYFEFQNQASPGMLLPWESTFLKIDSNPLPQISSNNTIYLVFSFPNSSTQNVTNTQGVPVNATVFLSPQAIRAQLVSVFELPLQGTLWLQVQTSLIVPNITNVSGIEIIVASTNYTIKQYPSNNQTNANATSTIST